VTHTPISTQGRLAENLPIRYSTADIGFSFVQTGGGGSDTLRLTDWGSSIAIIPIGVRGGIG
jgi:hypothetical protein